MRHPYIKNTANHAADRKQTGLTASGCPAPDLIRSASPHKVRPWADTRESRLPLTHRESSSEIDIHNGKQRFGYIMHFIKKTSPYPAGSPFLQKNPGRVLHQTAMATQHKRHCAAAGQGHVCSSSATARHQALSCPPSLALMAIE